MKRHLSLSLALAAAAAATAFAQTVPAPAPSAEAPASAGTPPAQPAAAPAQPAAPAAQPAATPAQSATAPAPGSTLPPNLVAEPTASSSRTDGPDGQLGKSLVDAINGDASLKGSKVTVQPEEGKVTLSGVTESRAQAKRIGQIVAQQVGVENVVNAIRDSEATVELPAPPQVAMQGEGAEAQGAQADNSVGATPQAAAQEPAQSASQPQAQSGAQSQAQSAEQPQAQTGVQPATQGAAAR